MDGLLLVFVAIGLISWVTVGRLVRRTGPRAQGDGVQLEAAQAIGVKDRNIVMRHLLPNGVGPIIVAVALGNPRCDPR